MLETRVDVVSVAVAGDDAGDDALQEANRLPCRGATLRVTNEALLRHDGNSVAGSAANGVEDIVPEVSLVLLVGVGTRAVNRENADVVSLEAPNGECAVQRRDARVDALEHAVRGERILLLLRSLELHVGDTRREVFLVGRISLALSELPVLLKLCLLVREPLADLLAAEDELARTVREVEAGKRALVRDRACNGERTKTGSRDGATGLVAVEYLADEQRENHGEDIRGR